MSLARYAKTLGIRYSDARFISSTPHRLGWVDKIKGVFTGKPSSPSPDSSSSSFSLNDFADQMDKAKTFGMLKKFEVGRCSEATISESFKKQSSILRYLGSIDPSGENLKPSHKQDAAAHCNCTISEVENTLSKYTWAKEAQKKMDKLKEEGKPVPKSFAEVQKMMGSTPLDVARSNLKSSGKLEDSLNQLNDERVNCVIKLGTPGNTKVLDMNAIDNGMDKFFEQIEEIERDIEKVSKLLEILKDAHEKSKFLVKASAIKALQQRMEKDVDEVKNIALAAKSKLEDLDKDNLTNRSKPGCGKGSSIDRSRTTATMTLKEKWKQKVFDFQKLREAIQQEHRDVVARTIFTVTSSHVDVEVIDRLIQTGNSGQIYQKVIQEQGRGQVMDTLTEIQNRYETLTEIEKQLLELQQIFLDMSVLVEVQGDMLDNIESQVSSAVEDVKKGTDAFHQTRKRNHQTYKWMWMAILVFILVAIVTVIAVLKPWKHL